MGSWAPLVVLIVTLVVIGGFLTWVFFPRPKGTNEPWPRTVLTVYLRNGSRVRIVLNTAAMSGITVDLGQAMRDRTLYLLKGDEQVIFAMQGKDVAAFTALPDLDI
jgi:hypothetical protein